MLNRHISKEILQLVQEYPVITVMGPRQAGKTTLVKALFPEKPYINLEHPNQRQIALEDPERLLAQHPEGAVLDEIQRVPELLSYIQVIVDEKKKNGMYILTGSHQLSLHNAITQSLAGRTALLKLLPLSLAELQEGGINLSTNEYLLRGFLPRVYDQNQDPVSAYRNYFQTYVERDVRQLIQVKDLSSLEKFMKICAGRIGQLANYDQISNEVGRSAPTINQWFSMLEASYIIFRLAPYYENFNKRIVKTPKIYFTEPGLATSLLGIEDVHQLERDPLRGALFENLAILELLKSRWNKGREGQLYFVRDQHGTEIDVLYKKGHNLIPIEIKSSESYDKSFLKNLRIFKKWAGEERIPKMGLIYDGKLQQQVEDVYITNLRSAASKLL